MDRNCKKPKKYNRNTMKSMKKLAKPLEIQWNTPKINQKPKKYKEIQEIQGFWIARAWPRRPARLRIYCISCISLYFLCFLLNFGVFHCISNGFATFFILFIVFLLYFLGFLQFRCKNHCFFNVFYSLAAKNLRNTIEIL